MASGEDDLTLTDVVNNVNKVWNTSLEITAQDMNQSPIHLDKSLIQYLNTHVDDFCEYDRRRPATNSQKLNRNSMNELLMNAC